MTTDDDHASVDFLREGVMGNGAARMGNARWGPGPQGGAPSPRVT